MNWIKLLNSKKEELGRGVVFRFPAEYPFEDIVDFMIIEDLDAPTRFKLICSTGYHAGQTELVFPSESAHSSCGISTLWLKENWEKWVYSNCQVGEVRYIEEYPSNYGNNT